MHNQCLHATVLNDDAGRRKDIPCTPKWGNRLPLNLGPDGVCFVGALREGIAAAVPSVRVVVQSERQPKPFGRPALLKMMFPFGSSGRGVAISNCGGVPSDVSVTSTSGVPRTGRMTAQSPFLLLVVGAGPSVGHRIGHLASPCQKPFQPSRLMLRSVDRRSCSCRPDPS